MSSKAGTITVSSTNPSLTNGIEQMTCAVGATTGARQIVCNSGYHVEGSTLVDQNCLPDARSCPIANGSGGQSWNGTAWNPCQVLACHSGYVISGNACVSSSSSRTCSPLPANTTAGTQTTSDGGLTWGACVATACSAGYSVQGGVCVANGGGGSGSGSLIYKDESVFHIRNDGSLYVWGKNYHGQLGVGDTVNKTSPVKVNLGVGRTAKKIVSNGSSTCSILDNNDLKCWGAGLYYQLGRGNTNSLTSPEATALLSNVKDVIVGDIAYCAVLLDNTLKCWGKNDYENLGVGHLNAAQTPESVDLGVGRTVKKLVMSNRNSCAILDDNTLKCWGDNRKGQVGTGYTTPSQHTIPRNVDLGSGRTAKDIYISPTTNSSSICSILDDDSLKCWGDNVYGVLGVGHTNDVYTPTSVGFGVGFESVGVLSLHTSPSSEFMCALLTTKHMACWGRNHRGQIDASLENKTSPVIFLPGIPGFVREIVLGLNGSNFLIGESGSVMAWGDNYRGQLGIGKTNPLDSPEATKTEISGVLNVKKIVSSVLNNCIIFTNNSVKCAGDNTLGSLGSGSPDGLSTTFTSVSFGALSVFDMQGDDYWFGALLSDDTVSTWGKGSNGRLGNGLNTNTNLPQTLIYP